MGFWLMGFWLTKHIYMLTDTFPADEKFGLTSQLRRATISVSSNIAEGSTRWGNKEQARFYEIAFGSLIEILNQLILSNDLKFIENEDLNELRKEIETISRMLNALYKAVKPN